VTTCLKDIIAGLKRACPNLKKAFDNEFIGLILFGSWVRGEAKADSDVDILIVFRTLKGFDARSKAYSIIASHLNRALTLIDLTIEDLNRELTPLMINIAYDGIIIYDETGILEKFTSKVKAFIKKAKLIKYKTPNGKYGWKRINGKPIAQALEGM